MRILWLVLLLVGLWWAWQTYFPTTQDEPGPAPSMTLWREDIQQAVRMDLEEYLQGVVAAEVPADFHPEALKAQAIAARTFALRAIEQGRRIPQHPQAVLSSDFRTGQGWVSREAFSENWNWLEARRRWWNISRAVQATRGLVLTYDGALIEALYHSTSGGHTEYAQDYFVNSRPYLEGVPDPYSQHSPYYLTEERFNRDQLVAALRLTQGSQRVNGSADPFLRVVSRTATGRVDQIDAGGIVLSGREVRERLGLRSSWFYVEESGQTVHFLIRGNGHGVGMSQYGADGMGRAGRSFETILLHYYRGAVLERRY